MPPWSNTVSADETRPEPDRARRRGARRRLRARADCPGGRPGGGACEAVRAGCTPGGAEGPVRARRAVRPGERRRRARKRRGRAARPVGHVERGRGRPDRRGSLRRPLRLPPRLSGEPAPARLRVRAVGAADLDGLPSDDLRPGGRRAVSPRTAGTPVLVLLRLQRLQRQARGRLGDDPARLRRAGCRARTGDEAHRGRLQPARGSRARPLGRRQARARRRHPPGRVPGCRLTCELLRLGPLPRPQRSPGGRLRRHRRAVAAAPPRRRRRPDRPGRVPRRVPLARLRGSLGRGAARLLQRADGPEHEDAVDGADHLGRHDLAQHGLRGAGERLRRRERHGLLLWSRGRRLRPPDEGGQRSVAGDPLPVRRRDPAPLARLEDPLGGVHAVPPEAETPVGVVDHVGLAHVPLAAGPLPRNRAPLRASRR